MTALISRRVLSICVAAILALGMPGFVTPAAAKAPSRPHPIRTLTLHPKFQRVRGSDLVASDRYVFISGSSFPADSGVLIDGRTTHQRAVSAPSCRPSALGGPWLALTCGVAPNQTYELYNIPTGSFRPFTATVPYADCTTNCLPIAAVGTQWVAFQAPPGDSHVLPTFAFQNINTGQTRSDPTTSTTNADLNSPLLTDNVCRPLQIPTVSNSYSSGWGSLTFDDDFAIAAGTGGAYLERCGSHLHQFLTFTTPNWTSSNPGCPHLDCPPAHNPHTIVWQSAAGRLQGLFLPSKQTFTIPIPPKVDPNQPGFANGDNYQLALTPTRLYLVTPQGTIWSAPAPAPAKPKPKR